MLDSPKQIQQSCTAMSARKHSSLAHTRLCALLLVFLFLAPILSKETHSSAHSSFVQTELHCIEAVILAKIAETANANPKKLLHEIACLQMRPAGYYERRCSEDFAWRVYTIQHHIQSRALEEKIRQVLGEAEELVSEIERLQPGGVGVFHRGFVSEYDVPHRSYVNARTRDNVCLAALRRTCQTIIAETFHRRYEDRDVFGEDDFQECASSQSLLEEVAGRLSEHMTKFAESEDSTNLIRDLVDIELEYYRKSTGHE